MSISPVHRTGWPPYLIQTNVRVNQYTSIEVDKLIYSRVEGVWTKCARAGGSAECEECGVCGRQCFHLCFSHERRICCMDMMGYIVRGCMLAPYMVLTQSIYLFRMICSIPLFHSRQMLLGYSSWGGTLFMPISAMSSLDAHPKRTKFPSYGKYGKREGKLALEGHRADGRH